MPVFCLTIFAVVWSALAIRPSDRADWALENLPVVVGVPIAVLGYSTRPLSDRAYVQAAIFLLLHSVGAHYTYSRVPAGEWMRSAFGFARNHYDRVVHFAFGLLMLCPVREVGFRRGREPGPVALAYFSVAGVALWSLLYEVVEWLVASVVDPAAGTAYLGTQGDPWDAEKDMGLALAGAVIAATVEFTRERRRVRGAIA
jgi:putative membrane protein